MSPPVKVKTCVRIKQVTILWTKAVVLATFIVENVTWCYLKETHVEITDTWEQFLVHDRSKPLNRQRVIESTYFYNMICYDNNVDRLSQMGSADKRYFLLALKQTISLWSFRHFKIIMKIGANPGCFRFNKADCEQVDEEVNSALLSQSTVSPNMNLFICIFRMWLRGDSIFNLSNNYQIRFVSSTTALHWQEIQGICRHYEYSWNQEPGLINGTTGLTIDQVERND